MSAVRRVFQLIYDFDMAGAGGGITRCSFMLAGALSRLGFQVVQAGLWDTGFESGNGLLQELRAQGVETLSLGQYDPASPYRAFQMAVKNLTAYLHRSPQDILHSHSEFGDIALWSSKMAGVAGQLVRTVHYGYRYEWRKRPERRLFFTNLVFPLAYTAEIGVSPAVTQALDARPLARLMKKRALFIPPVTDLALLSEKAWDPARRQAARALLGVPEDAPLFGSVGRVTEQKGYGYFVQAAARLLLKFPEAYFVLIGDGDLFDTVQQQVQNTGLVGRFLCLGPRRDIAGLLPGLDVFVSASLWEGLPLVVMEAMAAGVPVVATNIPGTSELIHPGETGWLARPADAQSLALALEAAWSNPAGRARMARQAHKHVMQSYSVDAVAERYAALYASLIPDRAAPDGGS